MSTFICNMETINVIVKGIKIYGKHPYVKTMADLPYEKIGQKLLDVNVKAFNENYPHHATNNIKFEKIDIKTDEGLIVGCLTCYEYQICELKNENELKYLTDVFDSVREGVLRKLLLEKGQKAPYGYGTKVNCLDR